MQRPANAVGGDGRGQVAFLRGSWLHSTVWSPWRALFDRNGYDSITLPWPGERATTAASRATSSAASRPSLGELLDNAEAQLSGVRTMPILIGHGLGAVIAQILVARTQLAAAAIALAPPAAGWVCRSAPFRLVVTGASLGPKPFTSSRFPSLSTFTHTFANTVSPPEAAELYARYVIPGSMKPQLRVSCSWRAPDGTGKRGDRPPLLLVSGGKDEVIGVLQAGHPGCDRLCTESATRAWERFGRKRYPDDVPPTTCSPTEVIR